MTLNRDSLVGQVRRIAIFVLLYTDEFCPRRSSEGELCFVVEIRIDRYLESDTKFYVKALTKTGICEVHSTDLYEVICANEI